MCCEQLVSTIKTLKRDIAFKELQLEELKKKPRTPELIDEIQNLEDEIISLKQDLIRSNTQYKKNCQ
ncbi:MULTISPECIES: hypothetical protein [Acinetobacter]|uniref:Uncharacterized protein n=1 Tax=Acinetobacter higginsii TaxID=70347 RepID=N9SU09_9GAMM|nr:MULTISPECIES: hypothetical protein [Acinetobacter]ENX58146.1 hypothetical protein F902_02546 [Acinetobacter higginsii]